MDVYHKPACKRCGGVNSDVWSTTHLSSTGPHCFVLLSPFHRSTDVASLCAHCVRKLQRRWSTQTRGSHRALLMSCTHQDLRCKRIEQQMNDQTCAQCCKRLVTPKQ
eukprot:jgi/Ulvmu1/1865/UM012_0021.1